MEAFRIEVTRTIAASAEAIFSLLSDPRGHVAIDSSGMLQGTDTAEHVTAVGDSFVMHMDGRSRPGVPPQAQREYDIVVYIERFVLNTEIAWTVGPPGKPRMGQVYGYRLTPTGNGTTEVTSYHDWSRLASAGVSFKLPLIEADDLARTLESLAKHLS